MAIKSFLSEGGFSVGSVGSAPIEVIDSSGNITAVGLTVSGNLVVNGSTTTINSTTTTLDDPIFTLGGDTVPTSDDNKDRGIEFRWHDGSVNLAKVGFFGFDDSTGKFVFIPNATNTSEVFSGTKGTIDANLEWADVLSKPSPVVTVTLTGDVTGTANATLTSLGNGTITINTTVNSDAIALGTDTTGAYVQAINNGSYLTGGNGPSGSESAVLTLAVDATSANTASKVVARDASGNFSAGAITATGMTVKGAANLTQLVIDTTTSGSKEIVFRDAGTLKGYVWNSGSVIGVGGGSGANSLFVDPSTGNTAVGANTIPAGARLLVDGGYGIIVNGTAGSSYSSGIKFRNDGYTHFTAGVKGSSFVIAQTDSEGTVVWQTTPLDRFTINSSGNTTLSGTLTTGGDIYTAGGSNVVVEGADNYTNGLVLRNTTSYVSKIVHFSDGINPTTGSAVQIKVANNTSGGNTAVMTLKGSGNVGIGITSPGAKLDISSVAANTLAFNLAGNSTTGQSFGQRIYAGTNSSDYALHIRNVADTATFFYVRGDGYIGAGTSTPGAKLEISEAAGATNFAALKLTNATGAVNANVDLFMSAAGNAGGVKLRAIAPGSNHNDLAMYVTNSGTLQATPAIFIQGSTNRVGINRSDPSNTLDVNGSVRTTDWYYVENSGNGMYNNANAMWWASHGSGSYSLSSNTTFSGIKLFSGGSQNTFRGHFYGDADGQGFLNSAGNWSLRLDSSSRLIAYSGIANMNAGIRVSMPGGAAYSTQLSTVTGAFKIKLPTGRYKTDTMLRMTIKIYQYSTGQSLTFNVGGYNYNHATNTWLNVFAEQESDSNATVYTVRFGDDGTSNCIWIGETNSTWSYPQVFVSEFEAGFSGTTIDWASGWTISAVTAFDTVFASRTSAVKVTSNNIGTYGVSSITGTANQVTASASTGAVTLSLPQNIHTAATPTFSSLTLSGDVLTLSGSGVAAYTTNAARIYNQTGVGVTVNANTFEVRTGTSSASLALSVSNAQNTTLAGNLTVSGGTNTFGTANGGTYIITPGTAASTGSLFIQGGNGSGSTAGGGVVLYGGSHASAPGWVRVGLAGTSKFAVNTSGLGAGTDVFTVDQAGNLTVSGTGTSSFAGSVNVDGGINFLRGSGEYSTYIKANDYIDGGYNGSTLRYWIELGAKGGTHIVLNTDGSATSAENAYDHFTIWQAVNGTGAIAAGARKFWITNTGRVNFIDSVWHKSSDGIERIHFGSSGTTFYKGGGTGTIHTFRNASDVDILTLSNAKDAILSGNLAVNGGTGTIDATSGTASATLNLVGRSSGTAKTASIASNSAGSLLLSAEGAGSALGIAANTGNTTVAYNLTVNGTGKQTLGQSVNATVYAGNSATTDQAIILSNTRRANYGDVMIAKNLEGVASTDSYATPGTSAATGYAAVEMRYGGVVRVYGNSGATTAAAVVAPNVLAEFTPTAIGLNLNTSVTGNLTVSGTGTSSVGGAFNIGANCYVPNANFYRGKNAAGSSDYRLIGVTSGNVVSIDADATGATFGGNITVSGTAAISGNLTVSPTWNSAGTNFTALNVSVTDTASGSASNLFKVSGASGNGMTVDKSGRTTITADLTINNQNGNATGLVVAGGNATFAANVTVSGNLIVNGTTTTVNSTVSTIKDPVITLGGGDAGTAAASDDNKDRGIEFKWHNGTSAKTGFFGYDDSSGYFTFIPDATNTSEVFSGTKGTIDANLVGNVTGNVSGTAAGETLATVTGRGASTSSQISVTTSSGGSMFTGTKSGSGYSDGVSGATFKSILDNPNGGAGFAFVSYYNASGGTIGASIRADGFTTLTFNSAASLANNAFNTAKTVYGALHFNNGEGVSTNARQTGITWRGGATDEAQAGIYVSQNTNTGTTMAFATTDSYATGPQIGMTISTTGVVNFLRNRPTYSGNTILDAANYNSYALPLSGGTLTGKVTFPSAVSDRPQFPGGMLGLDTGDGNFDIWGISRDYYPSHATATNAWGIRWDGDSNQVRFIGAGSNRLVIDLDGGASALTWEGNAVLHAGNYNSYAPTLTGTGASGTWGISVSGNASTATSAGNITGGNQTGSYQVTSGQYTRFGHGNQTDTNDGVIGAGIFDSGLNIVGTQTVAAQGRVVRVWGTLMRNDGTQYVYNSGSWGISVTGSAGSVATLTAGSYLTGTSFNGSAAVTFAVDATSANTASKVVARDSNGDFNSRNITLSGSLNAVTKSFVIPHPTKEGKKLRYGSLEGPENGVYVRGKLKGSNIIELPDYWTKLVDPESITVQLTPIGSHQKLYVEKIVDNKVYIANENLLAKAINCFFYVLAERCDVEKLEVEIDA